MNRTMLAVLVTAFTGFAYAQSPVFKHVKTIDLSTDFAPGSSNGEDAIDVTFDASNVYVAGFKASAGNGSVGVLKISDPFGTPTKSNFFTTTAAGTGRDSRIEFGLPSGNNGTGAIFFGYGLGEVSGVQSGIVRLDLSTGVADPGFSGGLLTPDEVGGSTSQRTESFSIDPYDIQNNQPFNRLSAINRNRGLVFRFNNVTGVSTGSMSGVGASGSIGRVAGRDLAFDTEGNLYFRQDGGLFKFPRTAASNVGAEIPLISDVTVPFLAQQTVEVIEAQSGVSSRAVVVNDRRFNNTANQLNKAFILDASTGAAMGELTGAEPINGAAQAAFNSNLLNFYYYEGPTKRYLFVVQGGANDRLSIYEINPTTTTSTVAGTLDLGSYGGDITTENFTAEIIQGGNTIETVAFNVAADGAYSFQTNATGTVDVRFNGDTWLTKRLNGISLDASGVNATMLNGDADGSENVDISDYLQLVAAFDTNTGDAGFDPAADFDGSGGIDLTDYLILVGSFDQSGD